MQDRCQYIKVCPGQLHTDHFDALAKKLIERCTLQASKDSANLAYATVGLIGPESRLAGSVSLCEGVCVCCQRISNPEKKKSTYLKVNKQASTGQ